MAAQGGGDRSRARRRAGSTAGWRCAGPATARAAEAAYRKALEVDPQAVSAYQNLASLLRLQGQDEEAAELLDLAAQLGSRNPFSYLTLGDLSLAHGRLDEARRFYRKALRLYREQRRALRRHGPPGRSPPATSAAPTSGCARPCRSTGERPGEAAGDRLGGRRTA